MRTSLIFCWLACCVVCHSPAESTAEESSARVQTFGLQLPKETPKLIYFAQIPESIEVEMRWIAENVGDACPNNTQIAAMPFRGDGSVARCTLSKPTHGWPIGVYRIEVWQGSRLIASQRFLIGQVMVVTDKMDAR